MPKPKFPFRDVSSVIQKLRDFLLGRKHVLHGRFPPAVAPRTILPADLPRGPDLKYSEQYYFKKNAMDSVKPPVVAPFGEGAKIKSPVCGLVDQSVSFECAPTPGSIWWWDGHCYYECVPDTPVPEKSTSPTCTVEPPCGGDKSPCQ